MRRIICLLALIASAGCAKHPETRLLGDWRVDPASIKSPNLAPGADAKPSWKDAVGQISQITVRFDLQPRTVVVRGMGETTRGTWNLDGSAIKVTDPSGDTWPTMTLEPGGKRIAVRLESRGESLQLDLVR